VRGLTREADGEAGLCAAGLRVEVVSVAEELGGGGCAGWRWQPEGNTEPIGSSVPLSSLPE